MPANRIIAFMIPETGTGTSFDKKRCVCSKRHRRSCGVTPRTGPKQTAASNDLFHSGGRRVSAELRLLNWDSDTLVYPAANVFAEAPIAAARLFLAFSRRRKLQHTAVSVHDDGCFPAVSATAGFRRSRGGCETDRLHCSLPRCCDSGMLSCLRPGSFPQQCGNARRDRGAAS